MRGRTLAQERASGSTRFETDDTPEGVYELAVREGWSDGLPIIPPTSDRVGRMVEGSGRAPGDLIGYLNPEGGAATVEKIAVNAVMAGCLPEYMPVLVAIAEALAEPDFNLHGIQTTTNPAAPLIIVSGPVRSQIGMNCGRGCLGPGSRANATIGRAVRLLMLNVGGASPSTSDMAVHGMPGKYILCLGENEEESIWEPLGQERGMASGQSSVTVVGAQGTSNTLTFYKEPESILMLVAAGMANPGSNNVVLGGGNPLVIFTPGYPTLFAEQGFTSKQQVREWLFEHAKVPLDRFPAERSSVGFEDSTLLKEGDKVLVCRRPEDILIVVAGGPEPYHVTYCPTFGDTWAVTKPVSAP